jgi:hypothetical protein
LDSHPAPGRIGERGFGSIQFALASALALVLFVLLANLVVVQYGKGAVRSALEQGARAGTITGTAGCEETALDVVNVLLAGRMSDSLAVECTVDAEGVVASATVTFEAWTPLTPDFGFSLSSRAVVEP